MVLDVTYLSERSGDSWTRAVLCRVCCSVPWCCLDRVGDVVGSLLPLRSSRSGEATCDSNHARMTLRTRQSYGDSKAPWLPGLGDGGRNRSGAGFDGSGMTVQYDNDGHVSLYLCPNPRTYGTQSDPWDTLCTLGDTDVST